MRGSGQHSCGRLKVILALDSQRLWEPLTFSIVSYNLKFYCSLYSENKDDFQRHCPILPWVQPKENLLYVFFKVWNLGKLSYHVEARIWWKPCNKKFFSPSWYRQPFLISYREVLGTYPNTSKLS